MNTTKVAELMTQDVAVIQRDSDVHELERLLLEKRVHGVPVVNEAGEVEGVVSQSDLVAWHFQTAVDGAAFYTYPELSATYSEDYTGLQLSDVRTAQVSEIMSPLVHFIHPHRPITMAAAVMIEHRIHRLIVVDERRRVVGILSALDLLRALPGVETVLLGERDESRPETFTSSEESAGRPANI